jgi:hypothetical protein
MNNEISLLYPRICEVKYKNYKNTSKQKKINQNKMKSIKKNFFF